jgi:hypothetical protein
MEGNQKKARILMGALSPYEYYNNIVSDIDILESSKGTLSYFENYDIIIPKIEPIREQIVRLLPPMLRGAAMMKIALDYYSSINYITTETDETEIDEKYGIDIIAEKNDEVVVSQVKNGEVSRQEFNNFCKKAPKFFEEFHKEKNSKKLSIIAQKLDSYADFSGTGLKLKKESIDLEYVFPEKIIATLPKYRRHFKELRELASS